jgi:hypothetical protein
MVWEMPRSTKKAEVYYSLANSSISSLGSCTYLHSGAFSTIDRLLFSGESPQQGTQGEQANLRHPGSAQSLRPRESPQRENTPSLSDDIDIGPEFDEELLTGSGTLRQGIVAYRDRR